MKNHSNKASSIFELFGIVAVLAVILFVIVGPVLHSFQKSQVIRDLKTLESAVKSYYIFTYPHTYAPSSRTIAESYLINTDHPK